MFPEIIIIINFHENPLKCPRKCRNSQDGKSWQIKTPRQSLINMQLKSQETSLEATLIMKLVN